MTRKVVLFGFMCALLLASVIAYSLPAFAQGPDSAGKSQVEYALGKIPGTNIIVHVAVIVPPGLDKNEVINQALNYQGAKKIEKSEYSLLSSLKWNLDQSGGSPAVVIKYNNAGEPNVIADYPGTGLQIFDAVLAEWNSVEYSTFSFIGG